MSFKDIGEKFDAKVDQSKEHVGEIKSTINNMDQKEKKLFKYCAYVIVALFILFFGSCVLRGCDNKQASHINSVGAVVPQEQLLPSTQAPMHAQPQVIQNTDPMVGVLTGMAIGTIMSNGVRYNGSNGYMDSRYIGPPRTVIINKTIIQPSSVNQIASKPNIEAPKIKNPGDQVAIQEKTKMEQEKQKTIQERKASIMKQRSVSSKSGFSTFSKSASSPSRRR